VSTRTTASLVEVTRAIADQLQTIVGPALDGGQILPLYAWAPTPPCIDIYPPVGGDFLNPLTFGVSNQTMFLTVRATVSTTDPQAGQELLLDLLDPQGSFSILAALASDPTFAGTADDSTVMSVTGLLPYAESSLLGAEWRLQVLL
jgi:hypothetical protein